MSNYIFKPDDLLKGLIDVNFDTNNMDKVIEFMGAVPFVISLNNVRDCKAHFFFLINSTELIFGSDDSVKIITSAPGEGPGRRIINVVHGLEKKLHILFLRQAMAAGITDKECARLGKFFKEVNPTVKNSKKVLKLK